MKKILTKSCLVAALALFTAFIAACGGNEIANVNTKWDINLPTSINVEYSYEDVGWFGDGVYYYVCGASMDELSIGFVKDEGQTEGVLNYYSALLTNIDSQYAIDCDHDLYYYGKTNEQDNKLCLVYDVDINKLIILQIYT